MNISDAAIEELEQLFVPPDITPDMYDGPSENVDYDYLEFLLGCQSDKAGGPGPDEMEVDDDPEYLYCPDEADQETKDPEELRNDKATKITKKEVEDLKAELTEFATKTCNDDNNKKKLIKRKKTLPGDAIFDAVKEHSDRAVKESKDTSRIMHLAEIESQEEVSVLSEKERMELSLQFQQHIQLLTQMSLLSSHNPTWTNVRSQCDRMMSDLLSQSLMCPNSVAGQPNLLTSMAVIRDWDMTGSNPTTISKNKNSAKWHKKPRDFSLSKPLVEFMSTKSVFYFPLLLPLRALNQDEERLIWTESEDHLLAFAMKESTPLVKKQGFVELSFLVQKRFLRAKTALQIQKRIKNLKTREKNSDNPVVRFINSGVYVPRDVPHTWSEVGNGSKSMMEMFVSSTRRDFSLMWQRNIADVIVKRRPGPSPIKPKPQPLIMNCALEAADGGYPTPTQPPILCVDGNNATPGSDSDTPPPGPPATSSPPKMSPIKKLILSTSQFNKSPLKAASERILKKYNAISPHKRTGSALLKSPLKKPLRKKVLNPSPKPVTPSRNGSVKIVNNLSPGMDCIGNYSPKSPCLPSPSCEDGDVIADADTPTAILGKRKSRHQKEAELTLALVGPLETPEEKDAREAKESAEIFQEILKVVSEVPEKKIKFAEIMSKAATEGTVQTYKDLSLIVHGHSHVQDLLLDLLSDSQAASVSKDVYFLHQQRQNMKKFILKLNVAYKHQPAYLARVLRELDSLCSDHTLTPEMLRKVAVRLFKHNQHLLDQFLMLVPGVEPPESMLPSPECVQFSDTDSDISDTGAGSRTETLVVEKSPEISKS